MADLADKVLFEKMVAERHCLHGLLPTKRVYDRLRPRGHSFELPSCTLELHKRSFIPQCLYKYIWWGSCSCMQLLVGIWGVFFGCMSLLAYIFSFFFFFCCILFFYFFHSSYTITDVHVIFCLTFLGYIGYCMSFENVFLSVFACTFDMCIKLLLTYLLTYSAITVSTACVHYVVDSLCMKCMKIRHRKNSSLTTINSRTDQMLIKCC